MVDVKKDVEYISDKTYEERVFEEFNKKGADLGYIDFELADICKITERAMRDVLSRLAGEGKLERTRVRLKNRKSLKFMYYLPENKKKLFGGRNEKK